MPKKQKKSSLSCFAYSLLCPSFVCKLQHECEDITKNAWRSPPNAQCGIEYRLHYSLFFTFLNYHPNRLFLYFLVNYRISIISLLFGYRFPTLVHRISLNTSESHLFHRILNRLIKRRATFSLATRFKCKKCSI